MQLNHNLDVGGSISPHPKVSNLNFGPVAKAHTETVIIVEQIMLEGKKALLMRQIFSEEGKLLGAADPVEVDVIEA